MTCCPLINKHWRKWVGSLFSPVPITPDESKPDGFSWCANIFLVIGPQSFSEGVGWENMGTAFWCIPGPLCQSEVWHEPQASDGVCGAACKRPGVAWLVSLPSVFLHLSPHMLVHTPLALFTAPPAMGAKFGRGWSLSGSFRMRSRSPRLKPPFLLFPADVTSCKKTWSRLKNWGTNYPSLLPVWAGSQACGQFHVSLSLICGWSCLIILGWSYDYNSIRSFGEAATEPPF